MARTGDLVPKEKAFMVIPEHIRHAQELLNSADLLIREKHYQTGFALATYASESIIKALILWSYRMGFLNDDGYKKVERGQGSRHDQRQKLALILLKQMSVVVPLISQPSKHRKKKKIRKKRGHYATMKKIKTAIPTLVHDFKEQWDTVNGMFWENAKRQALYVDWDNALGQVPERPDWVSLAMDARRIAKYHLNYLREINKAHNIHRFLRHGKEIKKLIQEYMDTNFSNDEK